MPLCLKGRDYNLISAYDGDEAMQMLNDNIPDLIILDMVMDLVNGRYIFLTFKRFSRVFKYSSNNYQFNAGKTI